MHGILQAERLGKHFAKQKYAFSHIYSSDLQRAYKTANAIRVAQQASVDGLATQPVCPEITALAVLREQDFGFYEGKPFYARPKDSNRSGKDAHRAQHQEDADFKDVESKESMALRAATFWQEHMFPIIQDFPIAQEHNIAIVSHGIFLSHIWRKLLEYLPKNNVSLAPGLTVGNGGPTSLEYLGGWSNTGYLELEMSISGADQDSPKPLGDATGDVDSSVVFREVHVLIKVVNGKDHLHGLRRTRGVGSSKHDESQKTMEAFFKKRKVQG